MPKQTYLIIEARNRGALLRFGHLRLLNCNIFRIGLRQMVARRHVFSRRTLRACILKLSFRKFQFSIEARAVTLCLRACGCLMLGNCGAHRGRQGCDAVNLFYARVVGFDFAPRVLFGFLGARDGRLRINEERRSDFRLWQTLWVNHHFQSYLRLLSGSFERRAFNEPVG